MIPDFVPTLLLLNYIYVNTLWLSYSAGLFKLEIHK